MAMRQLHATLRFIRLRQKNGHDRSLAVVRVQRVSRNPNDPFVCTQKKNPIKTPNKNIKNNSKILPQALKRLHYPSSHIKYKQDKLKH